MRKFNRRTIMAAGTTLAAGGLFGTASADEGGEGEEDGGEDENSDSERPDGVAWQYDGPYNERAMLAVGGSVYTQAGGSVHALDAEDGSEKWATDDIGASGTPSVEDNTVYTAGEPVRAFDAETGEIRWEGDVSGEAIAIGHGMVYTSSEDTVYALDAEDGSIRWERESFEVYWERDHADDVEETVEELTFGDADGETVYASGPIPDGPGAGIAAFDPITGETEWALYHGVSVDQMAAGSGHVAVLSPADETAHLYSTETREVVASDPAMNMTITGGAFFVSGRSEFTAYDLSEEVEQAWQVDSYYAHSLPVVIGDTVITAYGSAEIGTEERVMAYDLATGEEKWRYTFEDNVWSDGMSTAIAADENTVYVSRDGELLALRSEADPDEDDPEEDEPEEEPEDDDPDGDETEEETPEKEKEDEPDEDPEEPVEPSLELSVSAPDSIARGESASFDLMVWNHGDEAVEATVTFEIGAVSESTTAEIPAGDCYASYHSVWCGDLSVGDNEWTVTADGETESGTLTVTE